MQDSLTSKLSNLEEGQQSLWVVPASEVRRRKVSDPDAALKEFGATLVVKGSVMRDNSGVHLTLNLIRTKDVRQEGSLTLQDPSGDFAALQDQAVSGLARLMHVEVPATALHTADGNAAPGSVSVLSESTWLHAEVRQARQSGSGDHGAHSRSHDRSAIRFGICRPR